MIKKAIQSTDIPTKLIKKFCDFFSEFIYKSINQVRPLYKNDGRAEKSNYRPISFLSVSKIYERCLYS